MDRNDVLCIIEVVPVGTPATWCSRMGVAQKKKTALQDVCTIGKYGYLRNVHGTFITYINNVEHIKTIGISKLRKTRNDFLFGYESFLLTLS